MSRSQKLFLEAMAHWPAGVTVVTSLDGDEIRGATVSSFTSLSVDPPQVIVCLKHDSRLLESIRQSGLFCINMLSDKQEDMSAAYARRDPETPPLLIPEAYGYITCTLMEVLEPTNGTHVVVVGSADSSSVETDESPLVYCNRGYRRLM